jgi:hypothetical protein
MFDQTRIDGQDAVVAYLDADFQMVESQEDATFVRLYYLDDEGFPTRIQLVALEVEDESGESED